MDVAAEFFEAEVVEAGEVVALSIIHISQSCLYNGCRMETHAIKTQLSQIFLSFLEVLVALFDPVAEEREVDVGDGHVTDFVGVLLHFFWTEVDVQGLVATVAAAWRGAGKIVGDVCAFAFSAFVSEAPIIDAIVVVILRVVTRVGGEDGRVVMSEALELDKLSIYGLVNLGLKRRSRVRTMLADFLSFGNSHDSTRRRNVRADECGLLTCALGLNACVSALGLGAHDLRQWASTSDTAAVAREETAKVLDATLAESLALSLVVTIIGRVLLQFGRFWNEAVFAVQILL